MAAEPRGFVPEWGRQAEVRIPEAMMFLFDPPLGAVRYRVAYGGRGSAKSWNYARALLIHGARAPLRILCAREFQASIADSVHTLLAEQAEKIGLGDFYQVQQKLIRGKNDTEFIFKGVRRNIQEIKSTEGIDICWVEEAEAVSAESWRVLIPTIRQEGSEIWVSFNPAMADDPTYQKFVENPPGEDRAIIRKVTYTDNPWLPRVLWDEARELQRTDLEAFAHVWGGEPWMRSDAQVLEGKCRVDEFEPQADWEGPYYGADWGFANDPATLTRQWIGDRCLWIEYEARGVKWGYDKLEARFREVPGAGKYVIRADPSRPETINELVARGLRVEPADAWSGSVEDGIQHLRSYREIIIHPRCKGWIRDARMWRYKTDPRTDDVLPKLQEGHDHGPDSTRYALSPIIKAGKGFAFG